MASRSIIFLSFDGLSSFFHNSQQLNHFLKAQESDLLFSHKSVVSITHKQNIICSKTLICRQLFAGHVVGSRKMKRKEKIHGMMF